MLTKLIQSLPQFKGKNRLARWLLSSTIRTKKDAIVQGDYNLQYKIPNFVEPVGFDILVHGIHEKETSDFIRERIPQGGVFLDIGANIGSITMPVCRKRSDIRALSVEASPRVFGYLSNNLKNNSVGYVVSHNEDKTF